MKVNNYHKRGQCGNDGFSIVELLVVAAIIATMSVVLVLNFRLGARTATARLQVASVIISDIRKMQSQALVGRTYNGTIVCGYGVHYNNQSSYDLYAKQAPGGGSCALINDFRYQAGDIIVENRKLVSSQMEIRSPFQDIFFFPPDPKIYINNTPLPTPAMTTITIQLIGQKNCGGNSCTKIEVYNSGQIDLR